MVREPGYLYIRGNKGLVSFILTLSWAEWVSLTLNILFNLNAGRCKYPNSKLIVN